VRGVFACVLVGFSEQIMIFPWVKIWEFALYFKSKHNLLYTSYIFLILFRKLYNFILCFVSRASLNNLVNKTKLLHNVSSYVYFFSLHHMFRANMCPSSGEITVSMRNLVFVTLCGWLSGMQGDSTMHTSHPHGVTNTNFRIDTVISSDDGHIFSWNLQCRAVFLNLCETAAR